MIEFIRNFIAVNYGIIYFIYGLVFFVLGLAIALQSRHSSHLDLARSLNWLAVFGFLHGFHEWGDLFIPLQAEYLAPGIILFLHYVHLLLLPASFACLYGFGLSLLNPLKHYRWLHVAFAALLVSWLVLSLFPFRVWFTDFNTWHNAVSALARYLIGLPSGLLAAFALNEYAIKRITPYNVPRIVRALRESAIAMALYALTAGLIVPPVPFFPGNWLNADNFTHYLIIPPQLTRALIGLALAVTTIRFLEIFDVETSRQIEAMQQERVLADERERIARELHDGTIQKVYTAGLLIRSAENLAVPDTPLAGRLATAVGVLDDAIGDLRQNLAQLQSPVKSSEPLKLAIQKLISDPRFVSLVAVDMDLDLPDTCFLAPDRSIHVLAILQEALANVVRHARAQHVTVRADCMGDRLRLAVKDDGIGIPAQVVEGHGLHNMRDRASSLHGNLAFEKSVKGTWMTLDIPLEEDR
jgi:signal transduction histidine kinase